MATGNRLIQKRGCNLVSTRSDFVDRFGGSSPGRTHFHRHRAPAFGGHVAKRPTRVSRWSFYRTRARRRHAPRRPTFEKALRRPCASLIRRRRTSPPARARRSRTRRPRPRSPSSLLPSVSTRRRTMRGACRDDQPHPTARLDAPRPRARPQPRGAIQRVARCASTRRRALDARPRARLRPSDDGSNAAFFPGKRAPPGRRVVRPRLTQPTPPNPSRRSGSPRTPSWRSPPRPSARAPRRAAPSTSSPTRSPPSR